jgi:hypothetical protein
MRRLLTKAPRILLIAIAISLGTAAGALAYWQGTGRGTATTVLADAQALSFSPGTPTSELYPGGTATVAVVVTNPSPYFVQISSIVLAAGDAQPFGVDAGHGGCGLSTLTYVPQNENGAGWRIPPRAGVTDGTLTINMAAAIQMNGAAANACQGANFTVHLEGRS